MRETCRGRGQIKAMLLKERENINCLQSLKVCSASLSSKGETFKNSQLTYVNLADSKRSPFSKIQPSMAAPLFSPSLDHPFVPKLLQELSAALELPRVFH